MAMSRGSDERTVWLGQLNSIAMGPDVPIDTLSLGLPAALVRSMRVFTWFTVLIIGWLGVGEREPGHPGFPSR